MVKQANKNVSNAAICSFIRSRPKRICRSGSRVSLDVKSSFVQKKIWLFEGFNQNDLHCDSDDQLSDRDTASNESCGNHAWFLFTNLSTSQQCAKCMKRILPHRASYKCSACKQICHLKCAIKPEDGPRPENNTNVVDDDSINNMNEEDVVDFDMMDTEVRAEDVIVPKLHTQTRNAARLRKQILEDSLNDIKDTKKSDLNTSIQSQAKQKFSSMKLNFVKRCRSIKKKVQKKKKETDSQVDDNNNDAENSQDDVDARVAEEREAWLQSPVRTRLRSRIAELEEQSRRSSNNTNDESPPQACNITERRRRNNSKYQSGRTRVRRFLHDYDLTVKQILDRLDIVEEKIKHLQTAIPVEISKWKTLRGKYREDSYTQIDSVPLSSIESDIPINHETSLKHLEAENNLPSLSSGTASDEVYLVKDKSSSSHEFTEQPYSKHRNLNRQEAVDIEDFPEDSLPSGLPLRLRTDIHTDCVDRQTSTPVTERDLTFFKHSNRSHSIKHNSVTNIRLDTSGSRIKDKNKQDLKAEQSKSQQKVLSPEQIGVKHFLNRRRLSSPLKHNQSADRSGISGASPIASSTFRQGEDWMNGSQTSPFSFTFRNDYVDHSKASFTKVMDDSEAECPKQNGNHQNCSSNLSFTFRNDSQLIQTGDDEDLPGFTRNQSFHPTNVNQEHGQVNQVPVSFKLGDNVIHYKEESFKHEQYNYVERKSERKDKMCGMLHTVEADVHERRETSMLTDTDRTSLTNVTQRTGDFLNSFDERPNKSRWAGKDVFMFRGAECSSNVGRQSKSPERIDERGDNHKPPIPVKHKTTSDRNFIMEAEEKLKSFQLRRSSSHGENVTVGVCLSEKRCQSDNRLAGGNVLKSEKSIDKAGLENQDIYIDDTVNKCFASDNHNNTGENTLQEFERMEILCDSEALKSHTKLPSFHKIDQEISVETERVAGRSISRTSSMESKCSAKYHFLHDKGMIKIESPSLTLVCSSPGPARKEMSNYKLFEEDSTDLAETGSESDIEEIYIDDSFKLHTARTGAVSTDMESDVTNNGDIMAEIEEDSDSRTIAEQQLLNEYLRTVDDGQETWDNVMKWMHKECADTEEEELEEELKMMMEQEGRLNSLEGGVLNDTKSEISEEIISMDKNPTDFAAYSDNNQDDSVYYSFLTHSEDVREQCRTNSLVSGNRNIDRDDTECWKDDMDTSLHSSSLMYTIVNGTIKDVENLLNSDRTISEAEIKEGLIWALTNKNLPIMLLLLEDICKLICAAEEGTYVDVYPGYSEKDPWNPVFIVLSKTHPLTVWDTFMGLPVYRRKYDTVSREIDIIGHNDIIKSKTITKEEQSKITEALKTADLSKKHSKVTMVTGSPIRSKKEGKELVSETCIAVHCILKGFIPFGEESFPKEINGIPTDVREGIFDYCWNKTLSRVKASTIRSWENRELADLMPDTNNNEIPVNNRGDVNRLPGRIQIPHAFLEHIQDVKGPTRNGPVVTTTDVTTYNCVEHMNGQTVKETLEVFCDGENNSEEPMDIVMNKVVLLVVVMFSICLALYSSCFVT